MGSVQVNLLAAREERKHCLPRCSRWSPLLLSQRFQLADGEGREGFHSIVLGSETQEKQQEFPSPPRPLLLSQGLLLCSRKPSPPSSPDLGAREWKHPGCFPASGGRHKATLCDSPGSKMYSPLTNQQVHLQNPDLAHFWNKQTI